MYLPAALSVLVILGSAAVDATIMTAVILLVAVGWCLFRPRAFLVLVLPAILPLNTPSLGEGYSLSRLLTPIIFLAVLAHFRSFISGFRAIPRWFWLWVVGLAAAFLLSALANDWPHESLTRLGMHGSRAAICALIFAAAWGSTREELAFGWGVLGVASLVAGLIVLGETGSFIAAREASGEIDFGSVHGIAVLYAANSAYTVVGGFMFLGVARGRRPPQLLGLVLLAASLFSGRREALIGIAAGCVGLALARPRRGAPYLAICSLLGAGLYFSGPLATLLDERETLQQEADGEGTHRLELAQAGLDVWQLEPFYGQGPGTHVRYVSKFLPNLESTGIHNSLTGNLAEAGLLGGLSVLVLFGGFLVTWVSKLRTGDIFFAAGGAVVASMLTTDICIATVPLCALAAVSFRR